MTDNSGDGCSGGGSTEEKSRGGKKLASSAISVNHRPEMGSTGGSGSGDQEVVSGDVDVGEKRNAGAFEVTNGNNDQKGSSDKNEKGIGDLQSRIEHDTHLWTERERRKKLRNMFHDLHALIPHLPSKAEMSTIVDEAISYIRTLEQTLQKLETQKLERLHGLSTKTSVFTSLTHPQKLALDTKGPSFLGDGGSSTSHGHLSIVSCPNLSSFSFPQRSPPVFQTWTSSNVTLNVCGLDAHISICTSWKPGLLSTICFVLEKHKLEIVSAQVSSDQSKSMFMIHAHVNAPDEYAKSFPYDEVYKYAAAEIMLWVNSKSS